MASQGARGPTTALRRRTRESSWAVSAGVKGWCMATRAAAASGLSSGVRPCAVPVFSAPGHAWQCSGVWGSWPPRSCPAPNDHPTWWAPVFSAPGNAWPCKGRRDGPGASLAAASGGAWAAVGAGLEGGGGDKRAWKCSNRESGFCRTQSGRLGRGPRQAAWNPAESWSSSICRSSCTARAALAALWAALLVRCKACLAARCSGLPGRVAWRACRSWLSPNCSATPCGMSRRCRGRCPCLPCLPWPSWRSPASWHAATAARQRCLPTASTAAGVMAASAALSSWGRAGLDTSAATAVSNSSAVAGGRKRKKVGSASASWGCGHPGWVAAAISSTKQAWSCTAALSVTWREWMEGRCAAGARKKSTTALPSRRVP